MCAIALFESVLDALTDAVTLLGGGRTSGVRHDEKVEALRQLISGLRLGSPEPFWAYTLQQWVRHGHGKAPGACRAIVSMPTEAYLGLSVGYHSGVSTAIDPDWISNDRYAEYLVASGSDFEKAQKLYEWNARVSSALFELIHHFEVLLRNAIARELDRAGAGDLLPGTPWVQNVEQVNEVVRRIKRGSKPVTPGRLYAGLTFGFWQSLFGTDYEELWRHCLHFVFKNSRADRAIIAAYLDSINKLRNRIAHHGSMLDIDADIERKKILRLATWIDPIAGNWLAGLERVSEVSAEKPVLSRKNVLIVGAAEAWELCSKRSQYAYIIPADKSTQPVEYIGFYADQEVKPTFLKIKHHEDAVDWNVANGSRLRKSTRETDKKIGQLIPASLSAGYNSGKINQVFLLSGFNSDETIKLTSAIPHSARGRGSAFVKLHRYFTLSSLKSAASTAELT